MAAWGAAKIRSRELGWRRLTTGPSPKGPKVDSSSRVYSAGPTRGWGVAEPRESCQRHDADADALARPMAGGRRPTHDGSRRIRERLSRTGSYTDAPTLLVTF
eukprot:1608798-Pyramimonas_sp.AAC.2